MTHSLSRVSHLYSCIDITWSHSCLLSSELITEQQNIGECTTQTFIETLSQLVISILVKVHQKLSKSSLLHNKREYCKWLTFVILVKLQLLLLWMDLPWRNFVWTIWTLTNRTGSQKYTNFWLSTQKLAGNRNFNWCTKTFWGYIYQKKYSNAVSWKYIKTFATILSLRKSCAMETLIERFL